PTDVSSSASQSCGVELHVCARTAALAGQSMLHYSFSRPLRPHLPGASSDLQTDIERRRVTLRILHWNDQQLAAAIAKKEIVGVAHRAASSRRVGFRRVDAIGERVVEV